MQMETQYINVWGRCSYNRHRRQFITQNDFLEKNTSQVNDCRFHFKTKQNRKTNNNENGKVNTTQGSRKEIINIKVEINKMENKNNRKNK